MPKTTFVSTDPLIIMVERMIRELRANNNYEIVGYTQVQSHGFPPPIQNAFRNWYNFTRTAAVVMRLYMLKATDMLGFHNPVFNQRKEHMDAWIYNIGRGPVDNPINMAANANEAKRLSADFDRQFPHYILENEFEVMVPGDVRPYASVMYVIDFENQEIYHIASSLNVTRLQDDAQGRMVIKAIPHLVAFKLSLQNLPEEPALITTHPNTKMIKDLLEEYNNNQELLPAFQNLHLEDEDEDDIEAVVDNYFEQL